MAKVVVSAGHGAKVAGAVGYLNEHKEAVKVGKRVVAILGKDAVFYEETTATTQRQNLNNIVAFHNGKSRDLDVSIHFNSAAASSATGAECLYVNTKLKSLSAKMSKVMANAQGIRDRGPVFRSELAFLNGTAKPAILLEVCFVSNKSDAEKYNKNFEKLCQEIAGVIASQVGIKISSTSKPKEEEKVSQVSNSSATQHKVVKGETLYAIATKYGLTVDKLKQINGLKSNIINVGDVLKLKEGSKETTYKVVKGDTLWGIAQKYKTTVDKIKKDNGLKTDALEIGQKLVIK